MKDIERKQEMENKIKIGSHVGNSGKLMILGSVQEALSYGANAMMLYLGAPQNTFRKSFDDFKIQEAKVLLSEANISLDDVIIHAPYIVNLAQKDDDKFNFAVKFLTNEVHMTGKLGFKFIVIHPGAHVGSGSDYGIKRIADGINQILRNTSSIHSVILLETMAGKGTECGKTFEEIKQIIDLIEYKQRIGVCIDTCHIFDAGYDLKNDYEEVFSQIDKIIGFEYIKVIHLNDSKNVCNSHKDRHENIGFGEIGFDPLLKVLYDDRFKDIPKILETPYIKDKSCNSFAPYYLEIKMLKEKKFNKHLFEDID